MRTTMITIGVLAAGLMAGCAADVGEGGSALQRVDEQMMESQVLYLVDGYAMPLTAVQLQQEGREQTEATPVRVEIFDDVAVAWYAPEGVAQLGRDNVVALWEVVDRQPISDEVESSGGFDTVVPDGEETDTYREPTIAAQLPRQFQIDIQNFTVSFVPDIAGTAIIDFVNQLGGAREASLIDELASFHPGCS